MCAIWGCVAYKITNHLDLASALVRMAISSEDRGRDGTGVCVVYPNGEHVVLKLEQTASACQETMLVFLEGALGDDRASSGCIVVGNDRYMPMPQPDSCEEVARQPIEAAHCVGTHNGTFPEDDTLFERYGFKHETGIDSEILLHLYKHKLAEITKTVEARTISMNAAGSDGKIFVTMDREVAIQNALEEIAGGYAFGLVDFDLPTHLFLFRNFKPLMLCYVVRKSFKAMLYNSERKNIQVGLGRPGDWKDNPFDLTTKFMELPPYTGVTLNVEEVGSSDWEATNKILAPIQGTNKSHTKQGKALVICSGGMDSSLSAAIARKIEGHEVTLLHMDYGQHAKEREREAVRAVAKALDCGINFIDAKSLGEWHPESPLTRGEIPKGMRSAESTLCWVTARNLVFLTMAAAYAEANGFQHVYSGFNLEESGSYPDNTIEFFRKFDDVCELGTLTRIKTRLAVARMMKPDIIRLAHHLGVPMGETWSCDSRGVWTIHERETKRETKSRNPAKVGNVNDPRPYIPCGECGCCWTRRIAYKKAGIEDPQGYASDFVGPVPEWYKTGTFRPPTATIEELIMEAKKSVQ
jgi:7-cyano-7-deazaguanine synthase